MSQFADGGVIMTRPYISSSNYLRKMSHYSKGDWCNIFDALYYHFIYQHREYLKKNYSTSRQVLLWDKKTDVEQKRLLDVAKSYLSQKG
jgi:deoxyribodipyrimidine photolyase-related protein